MMQGPPTDDFLLSTRVTFVIKWICESAVTDVCRLQVHAGALKYRISLNIHQLYVLCRRSVLSSYESLEILSRDVILTVVFR